MDFTRRQFFQTAAAGAAMLAAGGNALAQQDGGSAPAGSATSGAPARAGEWKTTKVGDGTEMKLYVSRLTTKKAPAIIVLQEIFGVNDYIRSVADRIAQLGYVVAAPDLFHRTSPGFESAYTDMAPGFEQMKKMTDEGLEADIKATYDWLAKDSQVDASHIGSVGFCMGGKASFIANAILPLQAAAVYYGGGIADTQLARAKDQHAPLIIFSGGQDDHIGRDKQNAIAKALKDAGKQYVDVEFSQAQHGFFCDQRGSYDPEASREAWAILVAFYKEHLGA